MAKESIAFLSFSINACMDGGIRSLRRSRKRDEFRDACFTSKITRFLNPPLPKIYMRFGFHKTIYIYIYF